MKNFLKTIIGKFAPDVFKPIPEGILYILMQTISREISGECAWDTNDSCLQELTSYWSRKCRNITCPGYLHPLGLISYTSESDLSTSVDNNFNYNSFRYLTDTRVSTFGWEGAAQNDWVPVGTLGCRVKFDFGGADLGGFGAYWYGAFYFGDNSQAASPIVVHIGDKWTIKCYTGSTIIGTDDTFLAHKYYKCIKDHVSDSTNRPISGTNWRTYWAPSLFPGRVWYTAQSYTSKSIIGQAVPDPANQGSYGPVIVPSETGLYTGDHDTTYTIEIINFRGYVQNFQDALLQISLATADEEWLDFWGEYFGVTRLFQESAGGFEADDLYKTRILKEITRAKGTKAVILEEAQNFFRTTNVSIIEYHQTGGRVVGTDGKTYSCILAHTSDSTNRPISGANWATYWKKDYGYAGAWVTGTVYPIGYWDGSVPDTTPTGLDPAQGLWPWEFYIYPPLHTRPSTKFVKTNSSMSTPGAILSPPATYLCWTLESGSYGYTYGGIMYGYGGFDPLIHIASSDVDPDYLFLVPVHVGDSCLFGYSKMFSGVRFDLMVPGVGGTYKWQYWAGGNVWKDLTVSDTTLGFTQDGGVHWKLPSDWILADNIPYNIPDIGEDRYWVHVKVTSTPTVAPAADKIDILFTGQTCRGVYVAQEQYGWVLGTNALGRWDGNYYRCILSHTASAANRPVTGASWATYWVSGSPTYSGNVRYWTSGIPYFAAKYPNPAAHPSRDRNNCYIYEDDSFAQPTWEEGFQEIVDKLKTAGTIAIINQQ